MCGISRLANHRANSIWSTGVITWLDDSEKTTYDYYETGEVITGYLFAAISHLSLSLICPYLSSVLAVSYTHNQTVNTD
jgi:hypothetical protein